MDSYTKMRENVLKNVKSLQTLFGNDSDITIVVSGNVVVYGIVNKGKSFYSKGSHTQISQIATYHTSITISFLFDLSKEIDSIIEE